MCKVVHLNKEPYDVYIGRYNDSNIGKWGNPYTHHADKDTLAKYVVATRKESINAYRYWLLYGDGRHLLDDIHELKGKTLGCFCKPKSCHGDVLKELVDKLEENETKFW